LSTLASINIGAHRRLEVKIRTRKLLAFGAARRDRAASVMQASQNRIATITGEVDYEQVLCAVRMRTALRPYLD